MQETALITGATGYLGSQLIDALLRAGYNIIIYKRSTSDLKRIEKILDQIIYYNLEETPPGNIFAENKIDYVIHCATNYGKGEAALEDIVQANVLFPLGILEVAKKHGLKCFINTDTALSPQVSPYARSKGQFKDWLEIFSEKINIVNIRLQHFYGPGDDSSKFISWIIHSLLDGVEKLDLTSGEQKRDFIFIEDVIQAYLKLLLLFKTKAGTAPEFLDIELGSGVAPEVREVVELIQEITSGTQTKLNFGVLPYRAMEEMHGVAKLDVILKLLDWKPKTSLRAGMEKTVVAEKSSKTKALGDANSKLKY